MCLRAIAVFLFWLPAQAVELKPETSAAFDRYIRQAEERIDVLLGNGQGFIWADSEDRRSRLRRGEIPSEAQIRKGERKVPGGLIHDWAGAVFVPGTGVARVLTVLQNYDNHKTLFAPEVIDSRLLSRNGNEFRVYLRLLKKKVLTVVLNTEHEVRYQQLDAKRWRSRSASTRIAEVQDPGRPGERDLPPGTGHGFLWRLNSYWTFQERDDGTYVECEAISLTRDVPKGLAWLIEPIVRNLPRESLSNTLRAARSAALAPDPAARKVAGTALR